MFQHVIVKTPCSNVLQGITSAPELGKPDYQLALFQHAAYIEALKQCGVDVTVLPPDEAFPDSCFVEDVAVVTRKCAIVTNPGAPSRNGETAAIVPVLEKFYPAEHIHRITAPGTLEGGDVMMVGDGEVYGFTGERINFQPLGDQHNPIGFQWTPALNREVDFNWLSIHIVCQVTNSIGSQQEPIWGTVLQSFICEANRLARYYGF